MNNQDEPVQPKSITRHLASLQAKARTHTVKQAMGNLYEVTSGGSGNVYTVTVTPSGMFCTCDWTTKRADKETGEIKPSACSHTIAVFEHIALNTRRLVSVVPTVEDAERQHRPLVDTQDGVVLVTRKGKYKQMDFYVKQGGKRDRSKR